MKIFKSFFVVFRNYFGFSKIETRASLIIIPILFTLLLSQRFIINYYPLHRETYESDSILLQNILETAKQVVVDSTQKTGAKKIVKAHEEPVIRPRPKQAIVIKDLNTADTADLKRIYGVGSRLSNRIVKFRDALGGYHSMDQLYEVYNLDSIVIDRIRSKFEVAKDFIPKRINVNSATLEILAKHPYLSFQDSKLLLEYRNQHGNFSDPDELLKIPVFDSIKLNRLKPYLLTEH